jgi:hypothetical protein
MLQAVDPPRAQRVIGPKNARLDVEVGKPDIDLIRERLEAAQAHA